MNLCADIDVRPFRLTRLDTQPSGLPPFIHNYPVARPSVACATATKVGV